MQETPTLNICDDALKDPEHFTWRATQWLYYNMAVEVPQTGVLTTTPRISIPGKQRRKQTVTFPSSPEWAGKSLPGSI